MQLQTTSLRWLILLLRVLNVDLSKVYIVVDLLLLLSVLLYLSGEDTGVVTLEVPCDFVEIAPEIVVVSVGVEDLVDGVWLGLVEGGIVAEESCVELVLLLLGLHLIKSAKV